MPRNPLEEPPIEAQEEAPEAADSDLSVTPEPPAEPTFPWRLVPWANLSHWQCIYCQFDSFNESDMPFHYQEFHDRQGA